MSFGRRKCEGKREGVRQERREGKEPRDRRGVRAEKGRGGEGSVKGRGEEGLFSVLTLACVCVPPHMMTRSTVVNLIICLLSQLHTHELHTRTR